MKIITYISISLIILAALLIPKEINILPAKADFDVVDSELAVEANILKELQTPLTVPEMITRTAIQSGVSPDLAKKISWCESNYSPTAKNPHSSASGVFQFITTTFEYYGNKHWGSLDGRNVFNAKDSIDLAIWVLKNYGTSDWTASEWCWNQSS